MEQVLALQCWLVEELGMGLQVGSVFQEMVQIEAWGVGLR